MIRSLAGSALPIAALAVTAAAQTPFRPHADLYINDSSNDRVLRVRDLNYDGDHNDLGESIIFYDDILGGGGSPFPLSNNIGIASHPDGSLYIGDSGDDHVLWLKDLDGNGDAQGLAESKQFFISNANAMNIGMQSAAGLCLDGGVLWVAVAQTANPGKDFILRLEDLNGDGDALDLNEAREYWVSYEMGVTGTNTGASIPQDVQVGPNGDVYYVDIGTTSLYPKGVYRLHDADNNGTIDPTELSQFFIPPPLAAGAFFWSFELAADGWWYMADTGNDVIWRFKDLNGDGDASDAGESSTWWTSAGASIVWDCRMGRDGNLYVSESQNNERLFLFRDSDGDGVIDPVNEVKSFYDELVTQGPAIGQIRGFALDQSYQDALGLAYCTAQVNSLGCTPVIMNTGWVSASQTSGGLIVASNVRNQQNGVIFYGTSGRMAAPFAGGTMCIAPQRRRLGAPPMLNSGGSTAGDDCTGVFVQDIAAWRAGGNDPALLPIGTVVDAQCWSRDPGAPPANTNLTGGVEFVIVR